MAGEESGQTVAGSEYSYALATSLERHKLVFNSPEYSRNTHHCQSAEMGHFGKSRTKFRCVKSGAKKNQRTHIHVRVPDWRSRKSNRRGHAPGWWRAAGGLKASRRHWRRRGKCSVKPSKRSNRCLGSATWLCANQYFVHHHYGAQCRSARVAGRRAVVEMRWGTTGWQQWSRN